MAPFIVTLAKWTQPNARKVAAQTGVPQMVSIKYSHYAEFARFCLLLAKVKVHEVLAYPGQHVLAVLALRFGGDGPPALSSSATMRKVTDTGEVSEKKARAAKATATPVLALPDGTVLADSWAIAAHSRLPPLDEALRRVLDEEIAVDARHLAYFHVLKKETHKYFVEMCLDGAPWVWKILWYCGVGSTVTKILTESFEPSRSDLADACRERLKKSFETVGKILDAKKGAFLGGDSPGVADVAIAALAAPIVNPPENYGGRWVKVWKAVEEESPGYKSEVEYFRNTPVGRHTLKVYKEFRPTEPGFRA